MARRPSIAIAAHIAGAMASLALASPIAAAPSPTVRLTAGQLLGVADRLIQSGRHEEAMPILVLLAEDPNSDIRNEARFRHAQLLNSQGSHRDAAVLLRRVVDDRPDATPARLHLASTLQQLGDEEGAWRELRAVRSGELPPTVARFVDRLSASLQANKPFGLQVELSLAPDSNVNRATRSDTLGTVIGDFTLDEDSQAKSGMGAALRGMGHARFSLSNDATLGLRAGLEANLYRDKEFNDIALDLSAGPEFRLGPSRIGLEAGIVHQWYGMEPYQRAFRVAGSASVPLGPVSRARVDLTGRRLDNRFNDLQDGKGFSLKLRYERSLSPQLLVAATLGADRFKARDDAYSTRGWAAGVAAYRDIGRTTVNAGIDLGWLEADERLILLPDARKDRLLRLQLGLVNRGLTVAGFAPMTRLVMERNRSTVEFYDYRRTRMEFGITRGF